MQHELEDGVSGLSVVARFSEFTPVFYHIRDRFQGYPTHGRSHGGVAIWQASGVYFFFGGSGANK
jgi:hypothetical protein